MPYAYMTLPPLSLRGGPKINKYSQFHRNVYDIQTRDRKKFLVKNLLATD